MSQRVTRSPAAVMAASVKALASTGCIRPYRPQTLCRLAKTLARWGTGPAGGFTALAVRMPDRVGLIDELGPLTYDEIHRRSNAIARGLEVLGVDEGDAVAVMARNHRGFVEASVAAAKLGADVLYLNTGFAGPQLTEVLEREGPAVLVHDEEFIELLSGVPDRVRRVVAWHDGDVDGPTLEQLAEASDGADLRVPRRPSGTTILTSGTTGTPKGVSRGPGSFAAAASLVSRLPLRHGWSVHVAAPLFHTWGWAHLNLSMLTGSTLVLRRRFDPEDCLRTVAEHRCESLVVIPVMLQRILHLPPETLQAYDLGCVKVVAASGSALPGDLSTRWMDRFGDTLFNVYGSTECAWATIAQPAELRSHPGTAGRPPLGTRVRLYGEGDAEVAAGETGRIFVGNSMLFEGYTGGGGKDEIDGLMATGDVGRFEADLLFVEGRADDMIVSGGENVFPQEVEDCIARHDDVADVAAVGVDDPDHGQRLRAFVVPRVGAALDEGAVQAYVKAHLARYKVPREVWFVDELPRNATGKILKRELARRTESRNDPSDRTTCP